MSNRFLAAAVLFGFFASIRPIDRAYAQASLVAENTITGATVKVKRPDGSDEDQVFTLVRDVRIPEQWYYFPNQPRLTENVIAGSRVPELSLIRFTSSQGDGQLASAAILTFAVSLGASADALDKLKIKLRDEIKSAANVDVGSLRLSPIPINSASAAIYSPSNGNLIAEADSNSVVVPTDGNGKIVFAMKMNDIGADVFKAMFDGTGGIPVWIRYNFNGVTPPAGFKVTANWDQAYSFYSKDEKFRARASYYGLFSASASVDKTRIRDSLIQNGIIKVEAITGGAFTSQTLDNYLQPIVKRLNDELLQQLQPPTKVDPATAATPDTSGLFGGAGYSVAVKDVSVVKKGSEVWDFSFSSIIERAGAANALISVRGYPEDVRKMVILNVDAGNWERVYYAMPRAPSGIDGATLHVQLRAGDDMITDRYFNYRQQTGWVNAQGNQPVNGVWISLLSHPNLDRKTLAWDNSYDFSLGNYTVTTRSTAPFEGDAPVVAPADLMRVIQVSADGLEFQTTGSDAKLISVDVILRDGNRIGKKTFRPETVGNVKQVTVDLAWPVSSSRGGTGTQVGAEFLFNYAGKPTCRVALAPEMFANRFPADEVLLRLIAQDSCSQG